MVFIKFGLSVSGESKNRLCDYSRQAIRYRGIVDQH